MHPRRQEILDLVRARRHVGVLALARRFNVTPITIRRDLNELEHLGHLRRAHGSAVATEASVVQFAFAARQRANALLKRAIAREAARLVQPGQTVALDTGSTTLELARALSGVERLTILTTSLAIAAALHPQERLEVVLLGGTLRRRDPDLAGPLTEQNLRLFRVDIAFIGADAMSEDGLFTADMNVARCTQAMAQHAASAVLVADSSKFARSALFRFAGWDEIDAFVCDDGLDEARARRLRRQVPRVLLASTEAA